MKFDMNEIYTDRIKQIEIDMRRATHNKKWTELAKLKAEKKRLEELIDK